MAQVMFCVVGRAPSMHASVAGVTLSFEVISRIRKIANRTSASPYQTPQQHDNDVTSLKKLADLLRQL
jgi:hypothetical protein